MSKLFRVRHAASALTIIGMASCALPELSIDPSLDVDSGPNNAGSSGTSTSGGKSNVAGNASGGSSEGGGDAGSPEPGGGSNNAGTDNGSGGSGGGSNAGNAGATGCGTCAPEACCNGGCVDLDSDDAHCGACYERCQGGRECSAGECKCPPATTLCDGACVDLSSAVRHCGGCGKPCAQDQTCVASKCTGPCGAEFDVRAGGFVTAPGANNSCMHGLASISQAEATLEPADFSDCGDDCMLCMSGSIAKSPSLTGYANLIVTINQTSLPGTQGVVVPKGSELAVSFSNVSGGDVRLVLEGGNDGDTWCFVLPPLGTTLNIPYTSFNTNCSDNSGTYWGGHPLRAISLRVGSNATNPTPVGVCLNSFEDL
jgi:hypothetical protein